MKKFDFPSMFETYKNCWATIGTYAADPMCFAIQIWDQEGPVSTLTQCFGSKSDPETLISRNQAFVDVNNNPLAPEWLEEQEIAKPVILNGRGQIWLLRISALRVLRRDACRDGSQRMGSPLRGLRCRL